MSQPVSSSWEFTLSLPLGVVDNQLRKVEEQLRALNMKAVDFGEKCDDRPLRLLVTARLEKISGLVDSIAALVTRIDADIQARVAIPARRLREEETSVAEKDHSSKESARFMRKPPPDQDD